MQQDNRRVVIITGASSGFGKATARQFSQNGWRVIALARREKRLQQLQQSLGEKNCQIKIVDVCRQADVDSLVNYLQNNHITVDVLVNNAGLALSLDSADKASLEDWQTMVDTNVMGLIRMTRALLPQMVNTRRGHIINIGSVAGSYAYPGGNTYGATKAFVSQFSLNLRADLAGTGVRVTNIEPGLAETEFSMVRFHGNASKAEEVYRGLTPLNADDIAESIFWCANLPAHVNINRIEMMPTCQSFAPLSIHKEAVEPL